MAPGEVPRVCLWSKCAVGYLVLQVGERGFFAIDSDVFWLFQDPIDGQHVHRDVGCFSIGMQDGGSEGVLEEKHDGGGLVLGHFSLGLPFQT